MDQNSAQIPILQPITVFFERNPAKLIICCDWILDPDRCGQSGGLAFFPGKNGPEKVDFRWKALTERLFHGDQMRVFEGRDGDA